MNNPISVNVISIIRELLLRDQKVIIPGFGAFVNQKTPARLNRLTQVITPPSTEIIFDNRQQNDDGRLIETLVQQGKLDRARAALEVEKFVKDANTQIKSQGFVSWKGLGKLVQDNYAKITFEADPDFLKEGNFFDLPKINIVASKPAPKPEVKVAPAAPVASSATTDSPFLEFIRRRKWWLLAVPVVLIGGLSVAYFLTGLEYNRMNKDIKAVKESDKLVFGSRVESDTAQPEKDTSREKISKEIDQRTARGRALSYEETKITPSPEKSKPAEPAPVEQVAASSGKAFHVIAGAFLVPNNADRKVEQLKGQGFPTATVLKRGQYYMVSLGSYDSNEEAVKAMHEISLKLDQELWVKKVN
jgi:nucleoid DNA-binding protein